MACKVLSCEGAVFVLWGKPTEADMRVVLERAQSAAKTSGRPVVYITRVPIDAPPPESTARQLLNDLMPTFRESCASYHVILEGDGFLSAIKRAIVASLMQFGWPRNTFFVHATAKEVAFKVPREQRPAVESILTLAQRHGLLSASAPVDPERPALGRAVRVSEQR